MVFAYSIPYSKEKIDQFIFITYSISNSLKYDEGFDDEDIDNVDDLLDLLTFRKILWKIAERIVFLRHPPFWMIAAEKLQAFCFMNL